MNQRSLIQRFLSAWRGSPERPEGETQHRWRAVSIIPGERCCRSAQRCGSHRWLSTQAPRLPLPACDAAVCDCRYRHHPDRRSRSRRRVDREEIARHFEGTDRRRADRGRRASDHVTIP